MKRYLKFISLLAVFCVTAFQFAVFFDDPEHFINPDPDCPICQISSTQVLLNPVTDFCETPDYVLQILEIRIENKYQDPEFSLRSIRAPPVF
ncbi:hypothetical protein ACFLTH_07550 [Bacteroidota bacterium]